MNINWSTIKEKILLTLAPIFKKGSPAFDSNNLEIGVELFSKAVLHKTEFSALKGLPRQIFPALQDLYVDKNHEIGSLRILADSLEPFLKQLYLIANSRNKYKSVEELTLLPLFRHLNLNKELTNQSGTQYPYLIESKCHTFQGKPEYLEYLCSAYTTRNEVHLSPELNEIEIYTKSRDLLVVYIYSALKYKREIDVLPEINLSSTSSGEALDSEENKMLYDFISFGNTTTEVKTQVMNAYILNFLVDKPQVSVDEIKTTCDKYFDNEINKKYYERRIEKLYQEGRIVYSNFSKSAIHLSEGESKRLKRVQEDFSENKTLFVLFFSDLLQKYGVTHTFDLTLEKLTDFFISNFNIDVAEAYNRGFEQEETENKIYNDFFEYIKELLPDDNTARELFKELLALCEQSDFIIRLSASRVLGNLTNPDNFQNYVRQQERIVYVDTQIILHALCSGYSRNLNYDNIYFKIVDELLAFVEDKPNCQLRLSKLYLSEVAYQLKLALLLIPFEDFAKSEFSKNVFYQFYLHLRYNDLLEEGDSSFAEFLNNWLRVIEDDAYDSQGEKVIISNISDILIDHYGIEVVQLPNYENRDQAAKVLEGVIKDKLYSIKPYHVLNNDAHMLMHLSNSSEHTSEPFFLTWDKAFSDFRKTYKDKYHRNELISWHLFSPSKFLNHMSLLEFKIDPKSITHEYLSIIDSFGLQEQARTLFDNMNRFTDIKNITKVQRRKYVEITQRLFNSKEFSYEVNLPEDDIEDTISQPFENIIDEINRYFHDNDAKYNIQQYRKMLLVETYFVDVAEIIRNEVKRTITVVRDDNASKSNAPDYIHKITQLLEIFYNEE